MRISDWSSDVCSSDLATTDQLTENIIRPPDGTYVNVLNNQLGFGPGPHVTPNSQDVTTTNYAAFGQATLAVTDRLNLTAGIRYTIEKKKGQSRSEEHTSELQSLMRITYAVLCLKKK